MPRSHPPPMALTPVDLLLFGGGTGPASVPAALKRAAWHTVGGTGPECPRTPSTAPRAPPPPPAAAALPLGGGGKGLLPWLRVRVYPPPPPGSAM